MTPTQRRQKIVWSTDEMIEAARKDERERCAKIAEWEGYSTTGRLIAAAIRASGES
jgi:hypothetical protein